ncbi:uncharacterized protein LOC131022993 [Salvia miltiorrhiza]|uniref:uncharacterized protein LOC131022993 n=1 Tax=Salvia miltiorrhiza TaxID=226208 RepID=UPI0025AB7787|nr:uncharacterized protein LOC131022993 [Salvia miltiorrhiza]
MGNTGEGQGKNKRRFVTNSVQIEDVGDSTSGTTPQCSQGTQRENTRLKERVSFLKSQLKSLETELREHPQETVRNEVSDEEAYSSEEQEKEPRRETPHKRRAMGTSGGRRRNAPHRQVPRLSNSPFSDEILLEPLPVNYRPVSLDYDGTTDPEAHMARFEGLASLHQYGEGIKCRIFATTLSGMAQRWFHNLKSSSIYSYGDLYLMFMRQFASSKRMGKTAISLMDVKQEPQESLREYVTRFNMAVLDTPEAESLIKCYAFVRGLKQGPLFDALQITPPKEFDNIMAILPGYLQLEDAKAARRAEADKLRVKKGDNGMHPG